MINRALKGKMDEIKAISLLKQGSLDGLEPLVRRYQDKAYHAAFMILRDQVLAEDVVHQSFIKAFDAIGSFKSSLPFAPWFYRIVVNQALNTVKIQNRLVSLDSPEFAEDQDAVARWIRDPEPMPEETLAHIETARELRDALAKLNPEHRAVLVMRYYLGMSEQETAQKAARPLSTVKWWLRVAKKNMRELLTQDEKPCISK